MNIRKLFLGVFLSCFIFPIPGWCTPPSSMPTCHNYTQVTAFLTTLRGQHSDRVRFSSLAESQEGRSVWVAEIGRGDAETLRTRPAMLVVAGVEGNQPVETEAVMTFLDSICDATDDAEALVNQVTVYAIPCLNPDATERFFQSPMMEKESNTTPFDADHDGMMDEDGPDDLNGDGLIAWVRVEDAKGTLIDHPDDGRILIEADATKNEQGKWLLFREGIDNDKDEKRNEDEQGGVNFNKNFPFNYPWFNEDAGIYPVCEKETRALAEFVVNHPNIGLVFTYSRNGTLLKTPESGEASEDRKPQTKIRKEDASYYGFLGEQYREQLGISKEIDSSTVDGSLVDWIYFHRGRLSISAPVWNPEIALAMKSSLDEKIEGATTEAEVKSASDEIPDSTQENAQQTGKPNDEKKSEEKRGQSERNYLKWLDKNAPEFFLPWTALNHPDFPGQKAEVGGFLPFAKTVPPVGLFDEIIHKNAMYLMWVAGKLPRIQIDKIDIKNLGNDVFDIKVRIVNTGYLPTVLAHGERTGDVFPTRVEINVTQDNLLAGAAKSRIGTLGGNGGNTEVRWVLRAKEGEKIKMQIISAIGGSITREIELAEKGESR